MRIERLVRSRLKGTGDLLEQSPLGRKAPDAALSEEGIFKPREFLEEGQLHIAGWSVALLGDDNICEPRILFRAIVLFLTVDEGDEVGVLLDSARFTQV